MASRSRPPPRGCRASTSSARSTRRSAPATAATCPTATPARPRIPRSAATAAASGEPSRSRRGRRGRRSSWPCARGSTTAARRPASSAGSQVDRRRSCRRRPGPRATTGGSRSAWRPHNPDIELLRVQLDSIRAQTDTDWICLVSDDCSRPDRYREIEAELAGDARFVSQPLRGSPRRLPELRAGAEPGPGRGRARRALRSGRPLVPREARDAARRARATPAPSSSTATSGSSTPDGTVLGETYWATPPQQPHEPALAADRQHGHRAPPR